MSETTKGEILNPRTGAILVLRELLQIFRKRIESPEQFLPAPSALETEHAFIQKSIAPLVHSQKRESWAAAVLDLVEINNVEEIPRFFVVPLVVVAYCERALAAEKQAQTQIAWTQVAEAKYWLGVLVGTEMGGGDKVNAARELERLVSQRASAAGEKGAKIRHKPGKELMAWAVGKYREGQWKSANQAAYALKDSVIAHGRTIGAHLSETNAQRTIAAWINKAKKSV